MGVATKYGRLRKSKLARRMALNSYCLEGSHGHQDVFQMCERTNTALLLLVDMV